MAKSGRRFYVTRELLQRYGHTDRCMACTQLHMGARVATVAHERICVDRIKALIEADTELETRAARKRKAQVTFAEGPNADVPVPAGTGSASSSSGLRRDGEDGRANLKRHADGDDIETPSGSRVCVEDTRTTGDEGSASHP